MQQSKSGCSRQVGSWHLTLNTLFPKTDGWVFQLHVEQHLLFVTSFQGWGSSLCTGAPCLALAARNHCPKQTSCTTPGYCSYCCSLAFAISQGLAITNLSHRLKTCRRIPHGCFSFCILIPWSFFPQCYFRRAAPQIPSALHAIPISSD